MGGEAQRGEFNRCSQDPFVPRCCRSWTSEGLLAGARAAERHPDRVRFRPPADSGSGKTGERRTVGNSDNASKQHRNRTRRSCHPRTIPRDESPTSQATGGPLRWPSHGTTRPWGPTGESNTPLGNWSWMRAVCGLRFRPESSSPRMSQLVIWPRYLHLRRGLRNRPHPGWAGPARRPGR